MKTIFRSVLATLLLALVVSSVFVPSAVAAGKRIVFASDRAGSREIFVMDEDGSSVTQVTHLGATSHVASWLPNSSQILFRSDYGGSDYDLFTINADGTGLTNLTNSPEDESGSIASPDGSQIAYLQDAGGGNFSLRTLNLTTLASTEIQSGFAGFWWLSDTRLVIYTQDAGLFQLYTINADGTGKTTLTNDTGDSLFATATADGQHIAYYYHDDINPPELRTINADGTGKTTITSNVSDDNSLVGLPLWSPDGSQILFNYADTANDTPLMRINANGTGLITVASPSTSGIWGPEGDSIWYGRLVGGYNELFTANADGSGAANLSSSGANNEVFISAFLFEQLATEPPATPPATSEPNNTSASQTASAKTLAASGSSLVITVLSVLILGGMLALGTHRVRYHAGSRS